MKFRSPVYDLPRVRNPFARNQSGQKIAERLESLNDEELVAAVQALTDEEKQSLAEYVSAVKARIKVKQAALVGAVVTVGAGVVAFLSSSDEEDEDEEDELEDVEDEETEEIEEPTE